MGHRPKAIGRWLERAAESALEVVVPPVCQSCPEPKWGRLPLCRPCLRELRPLGISLCISCGAYACTCGAEAERPGSLQGLSTSRFMFPMTAVLSKLIHGFKYRHMRGNIAFLMEFLRYRPDLPDFFSGFDFLLPVPLHPVRRRERGYNQSKLLADCIGRRSGKPVRDEWLVRHRYTATQTRLGLRARRGNLAGAFGLAGGEAELPGARVLLVDDVFTTGATAGQCAGLLRQAGCAKVGLFALARVDLNDPEEDFSREMQMLASFAG